jgi:hypothetical protein
MTENNTTFKERLAARLVQMSIAKKDTPKRVVTPEQKVRNATAARERYASRTDSQKDADRKRYREYYHKTATPEQKARNAEATRKRYANQTEEQKNVKRKHDKEYYHHTHPYTKRNKEEQRVAANKRIEDAVKKANLTQE